MPTKSGYRIRTYEAETILPACGYTKKYPMAGNDVKIAEAYSKITSFTRVQQILGTKRNIPRLQIVPNGGGRAYYFENKITCGRHNDVDILLHELAHFAAHRNRQYWLPNDAGTAHAIPDSGHGPGFNTALLDLTRFVLGAEAGRALKFALSHMRIKVLDANGQIRRASAPRPMPSWVEWAKD
jgi:hypothetical protein